ncbi:unnamed protein product [Paramecium sonneborni]|uniref:H-type lectin domain-containing protein n=1 Tax=Paramecium sonneborni TaxID=65129 RepID=A0A8S1MXR6_9CILI|nr:unnamed protein product [Paramecium sonneborni]
MNWLIFLGFIYLCQAEHFLYESETGVTIQNIINKDVDINIKFKKQFTRTPKIAYSIGLLDMSGSSFMSEILNVNQQGFTIRVKGDHLDQISYNWMATDNPLVHIEYVKSSESEIQLPLFNYDSDTTPLVNSYLVGATFDGKKQFNQEIVELNKDIIKIATSGAKEFKLCLLISNFENSFKTDDLGIIVDSDDHTWFQTSKDAQKILVSSYEIPSDIVDFVQLMGISGFTSLSDHLRIEVNEEQENDDNVIKVEFGTWDESTIKSLSFYGFYIGNQEVKYYDQNCAYLYSECDYQGQEVKICDNKAKLDYNGQIKSIRLPKDAVFTLYGKEEFEGKRFRIESSKQCMDPLYLGK